MSDLQVLAAGTLVLAAVLAWAVAALGRQRRAIDALARSFGPACPVCGAAGLIRCRDQLADGTTFPRLSHHPERSEIM